MLYLRSINRFILISLALIYSGASHAATVADAPIGLLSPDYLVDFGADLYTNNTVITNQFSGSNVTFGGGTEYFNCPACDSPAYGDGYLYGGPDGVSPFDIFFSIEVTDALFSFRTNGGISTFTAYLDGVQQASFSAATSAGVATGRFYGFTDILFDRVMVSHNGLSVAFNLDNLQFNSASAVPVPAAVWLFGTALIGLVGFGKRKSRIAA